VAALIAVIVRPVILWLESRVHLSRGLAVGLVYLGLVILAPVIIMLTIPTITDALVYVGNLDYQSIIQSSAEWLSSTLTTIKAAQLPVAGFDTYVDRLIDMLLEEFQPFSPTVAVPPSFDAVANHSSALNHSETWCRLVGTVV
jgi:predicted PurR-regulated permease PerM